MTPQRLSQPVPTTAQTQTGRIVSVQPVFDEKPAASRKMLVVLGYWEGDKATAEELACLICDLERIKNREADFMVYRRHDATEFSKETMDKLNSKFEKVHVNVCRRKDGNSYPFSSNQMFYDLVTLLGQSREWVAQYNCFINLEPDCVPLRPGWITELVTAYREIEHRNLAALGYIHNDPIRHMNGVAVWAVDIYQRVPGGRIGGGAPSVAFDINQANNVLPLAEDSPLFYFDYRRPTIVPEDLFGPKRDNTEPAIYHGVKDRSARDAVREKFVSFTGHKAALNRNVFTFYQPIRPGQDPENNAIIRLWQDAWRSRGWNPIVLRMMDASRNRRYREFMDSITKLPTKGDPQANINRFIRWLALDTMGGTFLTDFDVLPAHFNPEVAEHSKGLTLVDGKIAAGILDRAQLGAWITEMRNYSPLPEDNEDVTDASVLKVMLEENRVEAAVGIEVTPFKGKATGDEQLIHFSRKAVLASPVRSKKKSELMEQFLRG